jgi:hypothetical protein
VRRPRTAGLAGLLLALGIVAVAGPARAAVSLDPFRRSGAASTSVTLDPVRVAAADATPAPVPKPAPATAAPELGKACETDNDCPNETICEERMCRAVQSSTNILYLYYREGTFTEIAGLYWSKRGPSGYRFLAPIYWHAWTPKSRSLVVAPLFWRFEDYVSRNVLTIVPPLVVSSRSPDSAFTWIFPLNFGWREKDTSHELAIPLFYASRHKNGQSLYSWFGYNSDDGDTSDGAFLWLYWHGEDRKARSAYNVLFPLLWDFKDKDDRSTVFFPLVWSYGSADGNTTLVIPWFHVRRPDWQFDTLFPIWWSGHDDKAGTAFKMLVPLVYWQSAGHGRASMWVSPLGGWSRDDDARSRTLVILPLLSFWRHDPERQLRIFTPLFVQHRSYTDESSTSLYALLLYLREDPKGTTRALLPLFWRFHDAETGATATALLPLFARRDGPRDTTTAVGALPLLWAYWRDFKDGGWSAGLFPLAFFGSNAGRSHAVIAPLFWHWAGAGDSTTVLAPFYYWHRDARGHAGGVPVLLAFWGARDGDSYAIQFPVLWHFTSARAESSTTATPLGYYHRDRDGWSLGVGPLVPLFYARAGAMRSHAVLFPIIWYFHDVEEQRSTTVVLNFWHRSWGGESSTGLFPLFYFRHGARPGGEDETTSAVFPLFYYHRDAWTSVLVTPVGFSARGPRRAGGFFGPYFWYRNEDIEAHFIPLLYADVSRRATGERTRQFGPFFALDGPGHKSRVLFPLFGRYEDEREADTFLFPTFFRLRRADGTKVDTLVPLFWRSSGAGRATTVVGPFYDHTAEGGVHDTGLVPFWFYARNAERSLTVVPFLLFVRRHDLKNDEDRTFCVLFWHSSGKDRSSTTLFPFWWQAQTGGKSHAVLFPIVWHYADTTAGSSSTLAGPFYWSAHGTARTWGLLPLVWRSSDPADGSHATGVMPIFYEAHGPNRGTVMTPLFGWHRSPTSSFTYGGPVVPLWVSHTNVVTETHTTVIPPLLLYNRQRPDSSLTTVAGLVWHQHDVTSSTTLGLPLYYDFHDFNLSRTTVAFPLFFRHANEVAGTSLAIAPLYYSHETPESSTTVGFPLYWDFRGKDTRTTLVLPVFARWRRPGYVSTWVFPTIYHSTGLAPSGHPDGTWHTVVAPFYAAAVKRRGDFMWEVLGGLFGHETVGRNRYLKLFFIRFEQEPAPRAQTAWYGQPLRQSRRQPARGLSMNTW